MHGDHESERQRRTALNQSLFREVNERLEGLAEAFRHISEHGSFVCECADAGCVERIEVSLADYERVRRDAREFIVRPGHVVPDVERVVRKTDTYVVVAKIGVAGAVADEADPRSRAEEPEPPHFAGFQSPSP